MDNTLQLEVMTDTTPIPAGDTAILSPMQERTVEATSHPPLFKNPAVVAWFVPLAWSLGSIPAGWTWSGWEVGVLLQVPADSPVSSRRSLCWSPA